MPINFAPLDTASRLLIEAELKVATGGGRFQPTGFPDLGPALFRGADGANWLLVESPQSMANRLEMACWDEAEECFDVVCNGIPFIRSVVTVDNQESTTSTVQESHRLASPYILTGSRPNGESTQQLWQFLKADLGLMENRPFILRNHATRLLQLDPSSLLHGVWLSTKIKENGNKALCGGKVRFPRLLSAYIEASAPQQANYGGVKRERVMDGNTDGQNAESGFGSIPYPRSDYTSPTIKAYFSLDLQLLRTLAMGERVETTEGNITKRSPKEPKLTGDNKQGNFTNEEAFLIAWTLYKINRFLSHGLTLRSNCQFTFTGTPKVTEPTGFTWPATGDATTALSDLRGALFPLLEDNDEKLKAGDLKDDDKKWIKRNVMTVSWSGTAPVEEATPTDSRTPTDEGGAE